MVPDIESCYNNQRLGFCTRKRIVHQLMCPGVQPWKCKYVEFTCSCVRGTYRRNDSKCVPLEQCDKDKKQTPPPKCEKEDDKDKDKKQAAPEHGKKDDKGSGSTAVEAPTGTAEATPVLTFSLEHLYYSGDSHGCPGAPDTCMSFCQGLGYLNAICDRYMTKDCYCVGPRSALPKPPPETPDKRNGK
ncbi:hypothetical protein V5799_005566 [Amblyomma americanum]|uniref:Uncharacterized protein n=1 Tax=Amblyomma americanum TaxID=6943 RepID=A0AAQ4DYW3_AMBAM